MSTNTINPKKLLNSKWTAVVPAQKEKHFIVTEVEFDEHGSVIFCLIEAVISRHTYPIKWQDLKDMNQWIHGWK
ncbi:MAG: TIGR02450 family Trp-rich protein [Gammaproteobacteria bacterium]